MNLIKTDLTEITYLPNGGNLVYVPGFYSPEDAEELSNLGTDINWEDHGSPRLVAWVGDFEYSYSRITHKAAPWTSTLQAIREKVEKSVFGYSNGQYQGVLLNLYRDENDSVAYHADNEPMICQDTTIASVSFGAARSFRLKYIGPDRPKPKNTKITLENGSLLLMSGAIQKFWLHSIPKSKVPVGPRINLTFRRYSENK